MCHAHGWRRERARWEGGRRERGGERERERVNTCMHTRLRGGARARASSAHCCATVCERFEQWGMVFVYLSVEGREGYVYAYIRMYAAFPDLRVDIGPRFSKVSFFFF